jgi:uncharacterized protein YggE
MTRGWIVSGWALLIALIAGGCVTVDVPEPRPRPVSGINVTGTGRVNVVPDTALVHLGVEHRAPSLVDATAEAARRMQAVLERVKALGIGEQDISTVAYSVEPVTPQRRTEDEAVRITGYRVVNVVQLRIRELSAVGRIVEAAMAAGATTIRGVRFTVADPAKPEAEARALAVKDAQMRAAQLAQASGLRLGELVSLNDGPPPLRPVGERYGVASSVVMSPGPIEPGQLEVTVSVNAHYRLAR